MGDRAKPWPTPTLVLNKAKEKLFHSMSLSSERVQKGIAHWDKQDNDMPAPNCVLEVQGKIIKDEGL